MSWDRLLRPLHAWVWSASARRGRNLLTFARTEADGSRHLARAAERTRDRRLRALFFKHASDEQRHADCFLRRGRARRLWKGYLRLAMAIAGLLGTLVLLAQYFVLLPLFALAARRSARREPAGWRTPIERPRETELRTQY